jgi:dTDP-glucose 4,6-dehydratase
MSKRVIITGGGGFCGAHLIMHLLHKTDWHLISIDSFRHMGKTDRITDMMRSYPEYAPRLTVLTHDLAVPFSDQFIDRLGKIDYIVSMASMSHVDTSIKSPRDFFNNNTNLMWSLVEYAITDPQNPKLRVEKFLHISTDEVYGPAPLGYDHIEGDYHRPSNPYAASKAAQEDIGHSAWRTYGLPYIQSNCMNLFGELQDPEKLIPRVIKCAVTGEEMPIFADKNKAAGTRKYLHARNQADATLFILNNVEPTSYLSGDSAPAMFNIVGEKEISNLDMALLVASYTGKKLNYKLVDVYSARPGHDMRYSLDGTKLANLGWKAPVEFESSIASTVKWTLEHPEWSL